MDFKQNFKRTVNIGILRKRNPEIPDGLMKRCKVCRSAVFVEEARQNLDICPRCGTYFRMHARRRIEQVLDEGSFEEWDTDLNEKNPLGYRGYPDKIADLREKTGPRLLRKCGAPWGRRFLTASTRTSITSMRF